LVDKDMVTLFNTDLKNFLAIWQKRENVYFQLKLLRFIPPCQDIRIDQISRLSVEYSLISDQRYDQYQSKVIMHCNEPLFKEKPIEQNVINFGALFPVHNTHSQWPGETWNHVSFRMKVIYAAMLRHKELFGGSITFSELHDVLYRNNFVAVPDCIGQYHTMTHHTFNGAPSTTYPANEHANNIPPLNAIAEQLNTRRLNISGIDSSSIDFHLDKYDRNWSTHRYKPFIGYRGFRSRFMTFRRRFPNHVVGDNTYVGDGFEFIGIPELDLSVGAFLKCGYELCERTKSSDNDMNGPCYTTDERVIQDLITGLDGFFVSATNTNDNWSFEQEHKSICENIAGKDWKDLIPESQLMAAIGDNINLVLPNGPTFVSRKSGRRVAFTVSYVANTLVILSLDMYLEGRDHFYFIVTRKYRVYKNEDYDKKLAIHPHNDNRPPYEFDLIAVKIDTIGKWFHDYPQEKKRLMDEIYDRIPFGIAYSKYGEKDVAIVNIGTTTAKVELKNGIWDIFEGTDYLYYSKLKGNNEVPHKFHGCSFNGDSDASFLSNHPVIIQLKNGEACWIHRCKVSEYGYQLAHHEIVFTVFANGIERKKRHRPTQNSYIDKDDEFMKVWKIQYAGLENGKHVFYLFHTRLHMLTKRSIPDFVAIVYV